MGLRDLMPINQRHHLHFIYCHFQRRQPENQNTTMQSASRLRGVHHCNSSGKMADGALSYRLEKLPLAQVHAASITVMLYFVLAHLGERAFRPRNGSRYCATLDWWLQVVVLSGGKRHPQIFPWLEGSIASSDGGENTGESAWRAIPPVRTAVPCLLISLHLNVLSPKRISKLVSRSEMSHRSCQNSLSIAMSACA